MTDYDPFDQTTWPPCEHCGRVQIHQYGCPAVNDDEVTFNGSSRAARRHLATDWAHSILDAPAHDVTTADYRHVVLVLLHELEQHTQHDTNRDGITQARAALATNRLCPGSGQYVPADVVDGNGIATCPKCGRYRPTIPTDTARETSYTWLALAKHRGRP